MIIVGDCLAEMVKLPAASVDAIVTDPPYHLTTGKKGGTGPASLNPNSPAGRSRIGTGFMGMAWDGGDIAFRPELWAEALRVAKPGAYLAAFGGTRTFHRMMVAIEEAGWELRDTLMWVYGSGFPKSHNGEWGGTALKPAWEPIVLARAPLIGTVEANWREHGTGALNIAACRLPAGETSPRSREGEDSAERRYTGNGGTNFAATPGTRGGDPDGRWPANVVHDGSDEVIAMLPTAPGRQAAASASTSGRKTKNVYGDLARGSGGNGPRLDSGSAARFFYCAKASREDRDDGLHDVPRQAAGVKNVSGRGFCRDDPYAEVLRSNTHPTVKPTELMRWLCRLVTPPGGTVLDPFMGSGSTGRAASAEGFQFIGIELDPNYAAIARRRIAAIQPGLALGGGA